MVNFFRSNISINTLKSAKNILCDQLTWLNIAECEYIDNKTIEYIGKYFTNLTYLDISNLNDIEEEDLKYINVLILI